MQFKLNPRYDAAPIDDDREHGLIALNTTSTVTSQKALSISGFYLSGIGALAVAVTDGSGNQVTSFGGGTQYTDAGTPPAHPVGPTLEFNNAGTWATVGSANPLPVSLGASSAVIGHVITDTNSVTLATLSAETTKVIGTVRNADGSGNLLTTNSTTYTAKFGLDANLLGTLGTAFSTAGKVDIKGADGDVFVRQATASNLNATVVGTGTFATQSAITAAASSVADGAVVTLGAKADARSTATDTTAVSVMSVLKEISFMAQTPAALPANQSTNIAQINAVTPLMGNGTTGTGSLRVTIASDNTAFAVNSTLSAETTKVIGVVRNSDGAGNLLTSNSTTYTAKFALDSNLLGTLGTAFTDAGQVNVEGAVATNVAITDKPINLGAQAVNAENSAVTTARKVQLVADLVGKLITLPYANPENFVMGTTAAITDTTTTSVIASAGGSLRNYITSIIVTNSHATVGTFVKITDGASTIMWEGYAAAAGGGFTQSFPVPLKGTAATAVNAICVTTGANVIVSCAGYKGV